MDRSHSASCRAFHAQPLSRVSGIAARPALRRPGDSRDIPAHSGIGECSAWRPSVSLSHRKRIQLQHHSQVVADNPMLRELLILYAVDMDVFNREALA